METSESKRVNSISNIIRDDSLKVWRPPYVLNRILHFLLITLILIFRQLTQVLPQFHYTLDDFNLSELDKPCAKVEHKLTNFRFLFSTHIQYTFSKYVKRFQIKTGSNYKCLLLLYRKCKYNQ